MMVTLFISSNSAARVPSDIKDRSGQASLRTSSNAVRCSRLSSD